MAETERGPSTSEEKELLESVLKMRLKKTEKGGLIWAETEGGPSTSEEKELLERVLKMRLKLIDRETEESRYCTLAEASTWDWANPETWRLVSGWQVTSFQKFVSLLYLKAEKGQEEIEILEAPRFTMLAGG